MEDGETNEGDTGGEEGVNDSTNNQENISELDKLKKHNNELEKELVKGRELKAEAQKLEAEKMVGGQSDAGIEKGTEEEKLTDVEYADKFMKGEVNPMKEDDISID